ncbi:MAG: OsmC family protein [bacterium]|nr:OsmC family protein [bacterium]
MTATLPTPTTAAPTAATTPPDSTKPQLKRIRATGRWTGRLGTDINVRNFSFATAEPVALGGDDSAPTPMDYVVGAFIGCIAVVLELVASEQDIQIESLDLEATGTLDRRGFAGIADVSPHFQALTGTAEVHAPTDAQTLRAVIQEVERRCPAFNLFKDAGVTPAITWILNGEVLA